MQVKGFDGSSVALERVAPGFDPHAHRHDVAHACFVLDGLLLDRRGRRRWVETTEGAVRFSAPGTEHHVGATSGGAKCLVFEFRPQSRAPAGGVLQSAQLASRLRELAGAIAGADPARRLLTAHKALATVLSAAYGNDRDDDDAMARLARLVEGDLPVAARELARDIGLHRQTLANRFIELHGVSPRRFRVLTRLSRAARFLQDGATGARAAIESGFADQAHLNKAWRAFLGGTPVAWAASVRSTIVQDARADRS